MPVNRSVVVVLRDSAIRYRHIYAQRSLKILQPQFRGSGGFGKKYEESGYGEWARKINDDIVDAVDWAISKGIADPMQIAIMGIIFAHFVSRYWR